MIDPKLLRTDIAGVAQALRHRSFVLDTAAYSGLENQRKKLQTDMEQLRNERNARSKEIGIRKVLGASVAGIAQMLTREFVSLVIIAILVAVPIAWWAMSKWLQDFTYRIRLGWTTFVIAGLAAIVIAVLTVSYQAIKAAIANPVNTIKAE